VSITTGDFRAKITASTLLEKKQRQEIITCLTAYDYASARLVDEAGIDIVLVGDSLAMVMLGYENTLPVTMREMLHHTRAVRRGVKRAFLVADMPFASYHLSQRESLRNAARFIKEAGAEAVKIEGGEKRARLVERMVEAEIPVVGHIGLTPQSVHAMGGYKVQGKTLQAVEQLMHDALALERAGACCVVLEGIPREVAAMITPRAGDSDHRHWRGSGVRWPGAGLPRSAGPDVFAAGEVCAPLCRRWLGHRQRAARVQGRCEVGRISL
jgi:3-methyl-2-oxobutanoate hydroxymethyltransferase